MLEQRIRLRFQKQGEVRFISHHDLMRLFERAVRRADIPIKMTSGFNPRPKISFPLSLSVGVEGKNEIVELGLDGWMSVLDVRKRLQRQLPDGIDITSAELAPNRKRSRVSETVYEVHLDPSRLPTDQQIRELLGRQHIYVERIRKGKRKKVDVRPYLIDIRREDFGLRLFFRVTQEGTGRPDEILGALGLDSGAPPCATAATQTSPHRSAGDANHRQGGRQQHKGEAARIVRTQVNLTISEGN